MTDTTDHTAVVDPSAAIQLPSGADLALSRETDFFHVADHLDEIRDISDYVVPSSNNDEIMLLGSLLAG